MASKRDAKNDDLLTLLRAVSLHVKLKPCHSVEELSTQANDARKLD